MMKNEETIRTMIREVIYEKRPDMEENIREEMMENIFTTITKNCPEIRNLQLEDIKELKKTLHESLTFSPKDFPEKTGEYKLSDKVNFTVRKIVESIVEGLMNRVWKIKKPKFNEKKITRDQEDDLYYDTHGKTICFKKEVIILMTEALQIIEKQMSKKIPSFDLENYDYKFDIRTKANEDYSFVVVVKILSISLIEENQNVFLKFETKRLEDDLIQDLSDWK